MGINFEAMILSILLDGSPENLVVFANSLFSVSYVGLGEFMPASLKSEMY